MGVDKYMGKSRSSDIHIFLPIAIFGLFLLATPSLVSAQSMNGKVGGISFRIDDNKPVDKYRAYAALFKKYGYNFGFALNVGLLSNNPEYVAFIKEQQYASNEFMDHTPNHATHYFTTSNPSEYSGKEGVDHIKENTVYLKITFDSSITRRTDGTGQIIRGCLISSKPGAFASFISAGMLNIGVHCPSINRTFGVGAIGASNSADPDTLQLMDLWGDAVTQNDVAALPYAIVTQYDALLTPEARRLLVERTLSICRSLGIDRPYTWIQPGGRWPVLNRASQRLFAEYGYTSGTALPDASIKCFNECNTQNDKRFGMQWGDFTDNDMTLKQIQAQIADKVAKHYVLIGGGHLSNLLGDWDNYLERTDSLLAWCRKNSNRIPVRTQSEWADILYGIPQNAYTNIIPPLDVDIDQNGVPDGYFPKVGYTDGVLSANDGPAEAPHGAFAISRKGSICYISGLAGLEKGENDFFVWTKGSAGDSVTVTFTYPEKNYLSSTLKFPAGTQDWVKYGARNSTTSVTSVVIPADVSYCDIRVSCSDYKSGQVMIGGLELRKKVDEALKIVTIPDTLTRVNDEYRYAVSVVKRNERDTLTYALVKGPAWLSFNAQGLLTGQTSSQSGRYEVKICVRDQHANADSQSFPLILQSRRHIEVSVKNITMESISLASARDTVLNLMNTGMDTVSITGYRVTDSTQFVLTLEADKLPPKKNVRASLKLKPKMIGKIEGKIIIFSDADNSPDSITISVSSMLVTDTNRFSQIPFQYSLFQNYPNPFNPSTTAVFSIPEPSSVHIVVWDVLGRKVRDLVDHQMYAGGYHAVMWDGMNSERRPAPSGVYFLSFDCVSAAKASEYHSSIKMLLVK